MESLLVKALNSQDTSTVQSYSLWIRKNYADAVKLEC